METTRNNGQINVYQYKNWFDLWSLEVYKTYNV